MEEKEHHCAGCTTESCSECEKKSFVADPHKQSHIKHVIGIVSGKGGVGKSSVTASLAVLLQRQGFKVGILDADITGPSIPKMFGITERATANDDGILPVYTKTGIALMSINLLLPTEDAPVIWRGPVIAGTVKQFWTEVIWGDLDYLLIDMPPGTGDVPLTVFQSISMDGIIIVTSPQDLVSMIVKKAYHMATRMNIPVLGVVENMSYVLCPDCQKKIYVFGQSKIHTVADELSIDVLAQMPLDSAVASLCDNGQIEELTADYLAPAAEKLKKLS